MKPREIGNLSKTGSNSSSSFILRQITTKIISKHMTSLDQTELYGKHIQLCSYTEKGSLLIFAL